MFTEFYIANVVREDHVEELKRNLLVQSGMIANLISASGRADDSFSRELQRNLGARVTLIAPGGRVLGDSEYDSSLMENHLGRPEVRMAHTTGSGWAIRHSDTLKYDHLYVAKDVTAEGNAAGYVRLSIPLVEINRSISALRFKLILSVMAVLFVTALLALWQITRIKKLARQVAGFSGSIASGEFDKRLFLTGMGEFDEITGNLNRMAEELEDTAVQNQNDMRRLGAILESIPDALLIIGADGMVSISSAVTRDLFGGVTIAGKPVSEVVRSAEFFSMMERVKSSHIPEAGEIRIDYPEEKYLSVKVRPLFYWEGVFPGYIAVFNDITRVKRLEQARKDFVANVSHEIKTPVSAIQGYAETLLDGAIDDRDNAIKFLRTIKSNSERMARLVDDLMTISKIELGVIRIDKEPLNLGEAMEYVRSIFLPKADGKRLRLTVSIKPGLETLDADRDRLIQIISNLVDNAVKFTASGGVSFGADEKEGRRFIFVEDTGIGVPPKSIERLGERFYRVDPSRSRELGGTGLGLAIVKHLVKAHGWEMKIESTEGEGTTVRIFTG